MPRWLESRSVYHINRYSVGGRRGRGGGLPTRRFRRVYSYTVSRIHGRSRPSMDTGPRQRSPTVVYNYDRTNQRGHPYRSASDRPYIGIRGPRVRAPHSSLQISLKLNLLKMPFPENLVPWYFSRSVFQISRATRIA